MVGQANFRQHCAYRPPTTTPAGETTTVGAPSATVLRDSLSVAPSAIYEQLPSGSGCGPTTFDVTFQPQRLSPGGPTVQWEVNGVSSEAPMVPVGDAVRAMIGPFGPETLDDGLSDEVLIFVNTTASSGAIEVFRGPTVVLHDCSP